MIYRSDVLLIYRLVRRKVFRRSFAFDIIGASAVLLFGHQAGGLGVLEDASVVSRDAVYFFCQGISEAEDASAAPDDAICFSRLGIDEAEDASVVPGDAGCFCRQGFVEIEDTSVLPARVTESTVSGCDAEPATAIRGSSRRRTGRRVTAGTRRLGGGRSTPTAALTVSTAALSMATGTASGDTTVAQGTVRCLRTDVVRMSASW